MRLIDADALKQSDFQDFSNTDVLQAIDDAPTVEQAATECDYCSSKAKQIKMHHNGDRKITAAYILTASDGTALFLETMFDIHYIDIKFCPMCGRRLI